MPMLLQKYIADQGICSRRKAEDLIRHGKVKVNGTIVTAGGMLIDPSKDAVDVDLPKENKPQKETVPEDKHLYVAMNKPVDADEEDLSDILTEKNYAGKHKKTLFQKVTPLVSMEKNLEGLIFLTSNADIKRIIEDLEQEYEITINEPLSREAIAILKKGMIVGNRFESGVLLPHISNRGKRSVVTVAVAEKKSRDIRSMFEQIGHPVLSQRRTRIGKLRLGTLSTGKWRLLHKKDII